MLPYEVASRVPVTLDRCGTCDGIWADDRELEAVSGPSGDSEVHFDRYMSTETRDEMIKALYDESGPHRGGAPFEEAFAQIFPTFASWVRRPGQEGRQ
jgi:Zn-finger nucleic acid-binding protein